MPTKFQPSQAPASLVLNDYDFHKRIVISTPLFVLLAVLSPALLSRDQLILSAETRVVVGLSLSWMCSLSLSSLHFCLCTYVQHDIIGEAT